MSKRKTTRGQYLRPCDLNNVSKSKPKTTTKPSCQNCVCQSVCLPLKQLQEALRDMGLTGARDDRNAFRSKMAELIAPNCLAYHLDPEV